MNRIVCRLLTAGMFLLFACADAGVAQTGDVSRQSVEGRASEAREPDWGLWGGGPPPLEDQVAVCLSWGTFILIPAWIVVLFLRAIFRLRQKDKKPDPRLPARLGIIGLLVGMGLAAYWLLHPCGEMARGSWDPGYVGYLLMYSLVRAILGIMVCIAGLLTSWFFEWIVKRKDSS